MFCKAFGYRRVLGKVIIGNIKSNYMTFWKRKYYGDSKKVSGCQGFTPAREAGGKGGARGIFRAEAMPCDPGMVGTPHYTFAHTHEMHIAKSEPSL